MKYFEAEAFSGSVVGVVHSDKDFLFCDEIEVHFFREEFADEAIHVLVGAALPRGAGMNEEEVSTEFLGNPLVLGEFSAIVSRQPTYAHRPEKVTTGIHADASRSCRYFFLVAHNPMTA